MDKFLEICNLPRLSQEEIDNVNRTITINEIESIKTTTTTSYHSKKVQDKTASMRILPNI